MEGPHGRIISRDGKYLYMTTGHGYPDGTLRKYALGPNTLVAPGLLPGNFPASIDVTPDMVEVGHLVTCTMPHGSCAEPGGRYRYTGRPTRCCRCGSAARSRERRGVSRVRTRSPSIS